MLVILSGPEPQRSILEVTLISELEKTDMTVLIIRGKPDDGLNPVPIGKIVFNNHLSAESIRSHLLKSKYIICRSGYSSLMDLAAVGRSAIIIPTPGQTEQEYLAEYHHQMGNHFYVLQEKPDLTNAFEGVKACKLLKLENISLAVAIKRIFQDKEILKDNN